MHAYPFPRRWQPDNRMMSFAGLLAPLSPRISWAPEPERSLQLDPAFDYGYSGFPTRKAADLQHLIRMARRQLRLIRCPLLAVQSTGDTTIWAGSADCILNGVTSQAPQKLILRDVPHACTISAELPTIANAIDCLMRR